jgi:hypothetical protein
MLEALKQWALALVLTAVAGSIAVSVSNSQNIKKYIKFACALVALAVMIAPVNSLFRGLPDIFNYNQNNQTENEIYTESDFDMRQLIMEKSAEMLEHRISLAIEQKTGIKPENIYIYSNINNNKSTEEDIQIIIEKVIINMPENTIHSEDFEPSRTQAYLKEILDCEIIIE